MACVAASSSAEQPAAAAQATRATPIIHAVRWVTVTSGLTGSRAFGPLYLPVELSIGELRREVRPLHFSHHVRLLLGTMELEDTVTLGALPGGVEPLELTAVLQVPPQYHAQQDVDLNADDAGPVVLGQDTYRMLAVLNRGQYFTVIHKALHTRSATDEGQLVAIRKVDVFGMDEVYRGHVLREVSILQSLNHPNLVRLLKVQLVDRCLYQVFEYIDMDMKRFLRVHGPLQQAALFRDAAWQCLRGLDFCHARNIIHCDLCPRSILVAATFTTFTLRLTSFELSRRCEGGARPNTSPVVRLWYRAPELLLKASHYDTAIDIWSLGCTLMEMATGRALFPGDSEIGTLFLIFQQLGTPDDQVWPGVTGLPYYRGTYPRFAARDLPEAPCLTNTGTNFLRQCMTYSPALRPSTRTLLAHELITRG